jgi:hypothetical protein
MLEAGMGEKDILWTASYGMPWTRHGGDMEETWRRGGGSMEEGELMW